MIPAEETGIEYTFIFDDEHRIPRDPGTQTMAPRQDDVFSTPDWAKEATWYQVMVERFRDGNDANNPDPMRPWRSEWYTPSPWEGTDGQTFYEQYVFARHYGGDLQGLRDKLGYLKDLGVNALYLNPIFQAESHHKYNATDFRHIDETYGSGRGDYARTVEDEDLLDPSTWKWSESDLIFLDFLKEAKKQGFRVIIDGVFNHVGTAHPAFQDVKARGPESPYADWFAIRSWTPFEYDGWAGFGELPAFRKSPEHGIAAQSAREHIFAITRRWMDPDGDGDPSDGIDGWRLDVPNEVPMPFWVEWRKVVKSVNPDAYITGEIWKRAEEWLDGQTFDAVMNYQFAEPALAWIGNAENRIGPSELDRQLANLRDAYPAEATYALQNLLDSHDTDRLVSKIFNPDRPYDSQNREQEDETYNGNKPDETSYRKARLAALLQMTYVGAPMVYYGDEAGMWGSDDPNNRKPMLWKDLEPYDDGGENHVMDEHLEFYRSAMLLRREHSALRNGTISTVVADDDQDTWAFIRENSEEQVLVALNAGESAASLDLRDIGEGWSPAFGNGSDTPPQVTIPPLEGRVWTRSR
ncbi:MAG: glycoside hydrolase family 13 protein [Phycisphaerales bacterium]|nr:glycoside hydrolase family 13 protein [Phycisphaerales bacterium]